MFQRGLSLNISFNKATLNTRCKAGTISIIQSKMYGCCRVMQLCFRLVFSSTGLLRCSFSLAASKLQMNTLGIMWLTKCKISQTCFYYSILQSSHFSFKHIHIDLTCFPCCILAYILLIYLKSTVSTCSVESCRDLKKKCPNWLRIYFFLLLKWILFPLYIFQYCIPLRLPYVHC